MITENKKKNLALGKNYQSSGNLFLDKITNGLSLGTVVLMVQDSPTDIYTNFLKYFISEGVVDEQKILFYYQDEGYLAKIIQNLPYKSTQVESILNSKRVGDTKVGSEMKIAWRYENIQYYNILEDLAKNCSYIFDLSRQLQDTYLTDKNKTIISSKKLKSNDAVELLDELIKIIVTDYQEYACGFTDEDTNKHVRIVVPNIFSHSERNSEISQENFNKNIKIRLTALRNLARSINGIIYISIDKEFVTKHLYNLMHYFSDYVFTIQSFLLDPHKLEDYDGLFYINKLPRVLSFKTADMETDTYGIVVEKRKVIIEKIDIGVEVDRNTKVKEKDVTASQAMCGHEKYSKDYEF
jgi:hypothetical protein